MTFLKKFAILKKMENENKDSPLTSPETSQPAQEPTPPVDEVTQSDIPKEDNRLPKTAIYILVLIVLLAISAFAFWFYQKKANLIRQSLDSQKEIKPEASAIVTPTPQTNFSVYEDFTHRVKLKYPKEWMKTESVELEELREYPGLENAIVEFRFKQKADEGIALVIISVEDFLGESVTLEEYAQIEEFKKEPSVNIVELNKTTLDRKPAYKIVFDEVNKEGKKTRYLIIAMIDNNKGYIFGYNAYFDTYTRHFNKVQEVIDSFELF